MVALVIFTGQHLYSFTGQNLSSNSRTFSWHEIYTGNVNLDTGVSYISTAILSAPFSRTRSRSDCKIISTMRSPILGWWIDDKPSLKIFVIIPEFPASTRYYTSDFQPGFREHLPRVPQPASKNDLACLITPDSVVEILKIFLFVLIRFFASFLHRLTVLNYFCC